MLNEKVLEGLLVVGDGIDQVGNGTTFSVKGNYLIKGLKSNAGSEIIDRFISQISSPIYEILSMNYPFIGITKMDEFGHGSYGLNTNFRVPGNRLYGGSSVGAAYICDLLPDSHIAVATSTGGSIAYPAALTGRLYGITYTRGLVSRYGIIEYSNSLDKPGLLTGNLGLLAEASQLLLSNPTITRDIRDNTMRDIVLRDTPIKRVYHPPKYRFSPVNGIEFIPHTHEVRDYSQEYCMITSTELYSNILKFDGNYVKNRSRYERDTEINRNNLMDKTKEKITRGSQSGLMDSVQLAMTMMRKTREEYPEDVISGDAAIIFEPYLDLSIDKEKYRILSKMETFSDERYGLHINMAGIPHIQFPRGNKSLCIAGGDGTDLMLIELLKKII